MEVFTPLWWMLVGHALADYPLQSDFIAREKSPWPKRTPVFWPWVLTSHALIHGGCVALATGSVGLGIAETVAHWFIDLAKCAGWTDLQADQCLHVVCKLAWFLFLVCGVV